MLETNILIYGDVNKLEVSHKRFADNVQRSPLERVVLHLNYIASGLIKI